MDTCRLQARDWLSQSTRKEFEAIISEAKLTPRQIEIIELKFIHDLKNYQIAMKIDTSVQTVERDLQQAYNSVKKALQAVTYIVAALFFMPILGNYEGMLTDYKS